MLMDKKSRHLALENLAPIIQDDVVQGYATEQYYTGTANAIKKSIFQLDENIPVVYVLGATTMSSVDNESVYIVTGTNNNTMPLSILALAYYDMYGADTDAILNGLNNVPIDPVVEEGGDEADPSDYTAFGLQLFTQYQEYFNWDTGTFNIEYSTTEGYSIDNYIYSDAELEVKFLNPTKLEEHFTSSLCPIDNTVAFGVHTRRLDAQVDSVIDDEDNTELSSEGQYIHIYSGADVYGLKIRYITTPHENPKYAIDSVTGLYDEQNSQNFCLSKFAFSALVDKISLMLGISLRDNELIQSQMGQEQLNVD
jgi:hypothetical protein